MKNYFSQEKDVIGWLKIAGVEPTEEQKNLYRELIEEELEEMICAPSKEKQVKELLDLLWVCIGYFYCHGKMYSDTLTQSARYPLITSIDPTSKYSGARGAIAQYVSNFIENPSLIEYYAVKTAIFLRIDGVLKTNFNTCWNDLKESNYSKFLPFDASDKEVEDSLKKNKGERYTPYAEQVGEYIVIKDGRKGSPTYNKVLKSTRFKETNTDSWFT